MTLDAAGVAREQQRDSEGYQAPGAGYIRRAIEDAGIEDLPSYTFIDLGSGSGRALFVAAEFPFKHIAGVEFSPLLHEQASANILRFRPRRSGCREIVSLHANARDFDFPPGRLALFLFNPFGAETMREVMHRLQDSLWRNARHVVVILLCPQCAEEVLKVEGMRLIRATPHHQVFEVGPQGIGAPMHRGTFAMSGSIAPANFQHLARCHRLPPNGRHAGEAGATSHFPPYN